MIEILISTGIEIMFKPSMLVEDKTQYRWINTVIQDPHGVEDREGVLQQVPYLDPPNGGFSYGIADYSPYYYDNDDCINCDPEYKVSYFWDNNIFTFKDYPADPRLTGLDQIIFNTCLVDTKDDKELICVNWSYTSFNKTRLNNITQGDNINYGPF